MGVKWQSWIGLTIGGWLLACLGLAALGAYQVRHAGLRCYVLSQPLTRYERVILEGSAFDCIFQQCRVAVKLNSQRGWACFFPRAWPDSRRPFDDPGSHFTGGNGAPASASQKSSGPSRYRTG